MALEMCTLQNGQNQLGIYVIEVTYSILRFPRQQKLTSQKFMKKLGKLKIKYGTSLGKLGKRVGKAKRSQEKLGKIGKA